MIDRQGQAAQHRRQPERRPRPRLTDIGRDIIRIEGTAALVPGHAPAHRVPGYAAKYVERIAAIFGTPESFGTAFSEAIVITPSRLHAGAPTHDRPGRSAAETTR